MTHICHNNFIRGLAAIILIGSISHCGDGSSISTPTVSSLVQGTKVISASGTADVDRSTSYTLTFSEAMLASSVNNSVTLTCGSSRSIAISAVTSGSTSTAYTVTPLSALPANTECSFSISAQATNSSGIAVSAASFIFTTGASSASPSVSSLVQGSTTIATSGTTGVDRSAAFTLTFSQAMLSSTITTSTVTLTCSSAQTVTIAAVTSGNSSAAYTITPASEMPASTTCTLAVTTGATNTSGTATTAASFAFTTGATSAPTVSSLVQGSTTIAATGTTDVAVSTAFTLTFSEAMLSSTASTTNITLTCSSAQTITIAAVTSGTTSTAFTITPSSAMPNNTSCTLAVGAGVTNSAGTAVTAKSFVFTTVAASTPTVALTGTLLSSSASTTIATSGTTDISGAVAAPLTMTFSTAMSNNTVTSGTAFECPDGTTLSPTLATSDNTIYTITPDDALPQMTACVLTLPATIQSSSGAALAAKEYTYTTGCGTSDNFSNSATFSSSSTICWTPSNASNTSTFGISSGNLVIATSTSTNAMTEPRAAKTFPAGTGTITLTALVGYSGIAASSDRCTLSIFEGVNNQAAVSLLFSEDEVKLNGTASDGSGGERLGSATAPTSPVYLKIAISGGTAVISYSSNGTSYTNLVTNGVFTSPSNTVEVTLAARSDGTSTTTCTFQDFTVSGATATGQYSN